METESKKNTQSQKTQGSIDDIKQSARDEALSAAEKALEAAQLALAAAERKLAEVQKSYQDSDQDSNQQEACANTSGKQDNISDVQGCQSEKQPYQQAQQPTESAPYQTGQQTAGPGSYQTNSQVDESTPCQGNQQAGSMPYQTNQQAANQSSYQQTNTPGYSNAAGTQNQSYQYQQGQSWQQPVQPHYAAPYVSSKDHVAAGLLAIFLGAFGVHKFYLGYSTQGFIMLAISILAGIFTIGLAVGVIWAIAIIEGIMYLSKSQSEFERIYVYGKREWF